MIEARGTFGPVMYEFGIRFLAQDILPDIETAGHEWLAVRVPSQPGQEKQQSGGKPESGPGGIRREVGATKRRIEKF